MRTLHLHVGVHRTATSSIQQYLGLNHRRLVPRGFLHPYGVNRHHRLMNRIFSGDLNAAEVARDLTDRADAKRDPVRDVILSDEDILMRRDLSPLAGLAEGFEVRPVLFLRRQDSWLESWYLQNIKWQWNPGLSHVTFEEFMARRREFHWIDYRRTVEQLERLFGRDSLRLAVFERPQMPAGPVRAFLDVIGLEPGADFEDPGERNASLSFEVSELLRCLPLDKAPGRVRSRFERAAVALDDRLKAEGAARRGSGLLMDPATRAEVLDRYAESNAWVAERHFGRSELFLDPVPAGESERDRLALPENSYEFARRLLDPYFEELIRLEREQQEQARGG